MTKYATILNSKKTISAALSFAVALLISATTLFWSGTPTPQTTAAAVTLKTPKQIESPVVGTLETKAKTATRKAEAAAKGQAIGSGQASYYGPGFAGRPTANGETFNSSEMTAAHRTLPFGTKVKVTNLANGKSIVVRINDRGPFHGNRIIDLSKGAAGKIDMLASGTAKVKLEKIA